MALNKAYLNSTSYLRLALLVLSITLPGLSAATDLLEVYRLALESDPTYRSAGATNRAAQELRPQAVAAWLPNINFEGNSTANRLDIRGGNFTASSLGVKRFNSSSIGLNINQAIYRKDLEIQLSQANTRIQQANTEFGFARQDLMLRTAQHYFAVLGAIDDLEFARASKEAIGQQLEQSRQRFEVGLIAITDVEEAQAGYDLAIAEEIDAENALSNAREALREITGAFPRGLTPLGNNMALVRPEPNDINQWNATALDQNLQLSAARLVAQNAEEEIRRIASGHVPTLALQGSYGHSTANGGFSGGSDTRLATIGLQLNVPLYAGGLVLSQTRQARHLYQQSLDDLERQKRATQRQARNAFRGVVSGISRVKALKQALISTRSALQAVEAGFRVGTRTSVDVLVAQRARFRAKRDYAGARYGYLLNILSLKQAAGTLSEDDLGQINGWLALAP